INVTSEAHLARHIGERSILIVTEELQRGIVPRLSGPFLAVRKEQILPTVIVVVDECHSRAESFGQIFFTERAGIMSEGQTCCLGDVGKTDRRVRRLRKSHVGRGEEEPHREYSREKKEGLSHFFTRASTCSWIGCRSLLSSGCASR